MTQSPDLKAQITVSTSTTWDQNNPPPSGYEDGIIVNSNIMLEIDGITLIMNPNKIIELMQGSKMIIKNQSTIKTTSNSVFWSGIRAFGDPSQDHYSTLPNPSILNDIPSWLGTLNSNQTYVEVTNSNIENATTGIWALDGSIVRARNSSFVDNKTAVWMDAFIPPTNPNINASFFMDCNFEWNISVYGAIGIKLTINRGVNIGGCVFQNNNMNKTCPIYKPTGILSKNAVYSVGNSGNSFCVDEMGCPTNCIKDNGPGPGCTFTQLSYGVFHNPGYHPVVEDSRIGIRYSSFNNNYSSIYVEDNIGGTNLPSNSNIEIIQNTFMGDRNILDNMFSYVNSSGGFCSYSNNNLPADYIQDIRVFIMSTTIYNNSFFFTGKNIKHISLDNTAFGQGRKSMVVNNLFNNADPNTIANDNVFGLSTFDNNSSLHIFCNTFENLGTDIKINPGSLVKDPIEGKNTDDPAGNKFSAMLGGRLRIDNTGNNIIKYKILPTSPQDEDPQLSPFSINIQVGESANEEEPECELTCEDLDPDNSLSRKQSLYIKDIKIMPNPADKELSLVFEQQDHYKIRVFDVLGKEIYQTNTSTNFVQIPTAQLPNGTYFVKISSSNGAFFHSKVMVQH